KLNTSHAVLLSKLNTSHAVLLLGWAGADDRSVLKYADLYEKRGLDTVRFTSEMKAFSPKGLSDMRNMDALFPLLDQIQNRRLVMHIFSMNGIYSLVTLLHNKKYSDLFMKTDGVIWDSCPVDSKLIPYLIGYNQVINNVHKNTLEKGTFLDRLSFMAGKTMFLSSAVMDATRQCVHVLTGGRISEVNPYYYVRDHPQLPERHTFFYSKADVLCKAPPIRSFHQYLTEKRKMEVDAIYFTDSPHVKHYPDHPIEYNEGIDRMLNSLRRSISKL
ncbi:hypothetical protein PENTCL1PPCAC_22585, partial [Pristionchus entomophagus]